MKHSIDLISDLYLTKDTVFTWNQIPTSLFCVVAGNISEDREVLKAALRHLGTCYRAVLFTDGPLEHIRTLSDLTQSYEQLIQDLAGIPNVTYLYNDIVVLGDTAFLATNGWWALNFAPLVDYPQAVQWVMDTYNIPHGAVEFIQSTSVDDASYLAHSISNLQRHNYVRKIIVITSTIPHYRLIEHDLELQRSHHVTTCGNSLLSSAAKIDTEHKISTWCFGSYSGQIDMVIDNIRYVNNAKGSKGSTGYKAVYYPLRIEFETSHDSSGSILI